VFNEVGRDHNQWSSRGVNEILGVVFAHLVGHNGRVGENIDPFPQKKLDGCRVDRNDSVDLSACIFAAQVIGKCMGMAGPLNRVTSRYSLYSWTSNSVFEPKVERIPWSVNPCAER